MTKNKKTSINYKAIIAIILVLAFLGTYVISFMNTKKISDHRDEDGKSAGGSGTNNDTNTVTVNGRSFPEPKFIKQGELNFLNKDRNVIKNIAIEIADNDAKREQGLMRSEERRVGKEC